MSNVELQGYCDLILDYSLQTRPGDYVFIQTTTLAAPLVELMYAGILMRGGIPEIQLNLKSQENNFNAYAHPLSVAWINPTYARAMETFDAYLYIRAPFIEQEYHTMDPLLLAERRKSVAPFQKFYATRTADKSMRRSLCQYPTESSARDAGMSLGEYEQFVLKSCFLHTPDPQLRWRELSDFQADLVVFLNKASDIRYLNDLTDLTFSVKNRTWINSDGKTNMPSGEIFTSPVEDSVQGHIYFDYPLMYQQKEIQGIALDITDGVVQKGSAVIGHDVLQEILEVPGARMFGEAAIGTNPFIQIPTKNILFDEKMSGTIHMALGQSYLQCGGKNESSLHLDLIADMKVSGQIYADGTLIYERGVFKI